MEIIKELKINEFKIEDVPLADGYKLLESNHFHDLKYLCLSKDQSPNDRIMDRNLEQMKPS